MIFLSHNSNDKPIIEPIALRLATIFGRDNVFYDSWSMQPGDGIIDRMNVGLENCTHFFVFVSQNSMKSSMVKMEWQNAIYASSKGKCKVIPVRLDQQAMPAIMSQTLYIDLYSNGIDVAVGQIVNVIQGNSTFSAKSQSFSNLTYRIESATTAEMSIKIRASHFLEPVANLLILVKNQENELAFEFPEEGFFIGGFNKNVRLNNGNTYNAQAMKSPRGITPTLPLLLRIKKTSAPIIEFIDILHQTSENQYEPIPRAI